MSENGNRASGAVIKAIGFFVAVSLIQKIVNNPEESVAADSEQRLNRCAGSSGRPECQITVPVERNGTLQNMQVDSIERMGLSESNSRTYVLTGSVYDQGGARRCNLRILSDFSYMAGRPTITWDDCTIHEVTAIDDPESLSADNDDRKDYSPTELVYEPTTGQVTAVPRREPGF